MNQPLTRVPRAPTRRHWRLAAGALVLSALAATACSSGTRTPTIPRAAGATVTTISESHAMLLVVQCFRQHGIPTMPDPTVVSSGPAKGQTTFDKRALLAYPQTVVNQAVTACRIALEQAGAPSGPPPDMSQQEIQARLALARCARAHGVPNLPDPNPTTGEFTLPPGLSTNSPQLLAAAQACRSLLNPAGVSIPGGSGGSGGG
jgi:hypothetical protein